MRKAITYRWIIVAGMILEMSQPMFAQEDKGQSAAGQITAIHRIEREQFGNLATQVRLTGLQRDQQQVASLIGMLKQPPEMSSSHPVALGFTAPMSYHLTVGILRALQRIGGKSTLEALYALSSDLRDDPFYTITIARIETEVKFPTAQLKFETLKRKVDYFLQRVGVTKAQLQAYLANVEKVRAESKKGVPSVEVLALRQVAEFAVEAYENGIKDSLQVLEEIPYHNDPPTLLRIQLATIPPSQRANWLIAKIKGRSVVNNWTNYEVQALIDCGKLAADTLVATLRELLSQQATPVAVQPLVWALGAVEPSALESLLQEYPNHPGFSQLARDTLQLSPMVRASDW